MSAAKRPAGKKVAAEKATSKPAAAKSKKPATRKPATKKPATKKPATKKPATRKEAAASRPAAQKPAAADERAASKPPSAKVTSRADAAANAAGDLIDARIAALGDWRGERLAELRAVIRGADPGVVEEWKWGTPVWSCGGILCTGESYKQVVKLTFARGAALPDPKGLFNASLEGNRRRAIDVREHDVVDARALAALVRAAIAENHR